MFRFLTFCLLALSIPFIKGQGEESEEEEEEEVELVCVSGFAAEGDDEGSSTCFLDDELDVQGNRWGWTNELDDGTDTYTFNLYADAGGCNRTAGVLAGIVEVDLVNNEVTYDMDDFISGLGFLLYEVHLYYGPEPLPGPPRKGKGKNTVAPGQFPHNAVFEIPVDNYTFSDIPPIDEGMFLIAHAKICGSGGGGSEARGSIDAAGGGDGDTTTRDILVYVSVGVFVGALVVLAIKRWRQKPYMKVATVNTASP